MDTPQPTRARGPAKADVVEMTRSCPEAAFLLVCPKGLKLSQRAAAPTLVGKASNHIITSPSNAWDSLGGSTITKSTQPETYEWTS